MIIVEIRFFKSEFENKLHSAQDLILPLYLFHISYASKMTSFSAAMKIVYLSTLDVYFSIDAIDQHETYTINRRNCIVLLYLD